MFLHSLSPCHPLLLFSVLTTLFLPHSLVHLIPCFYIPSSFAPPPLFLSIRHSSIRRALCTLFIPRNVVPSFLHSLIPSLFHIHLLLHYPPFLPHISILFWSGITEDANFIFVPVILTMKYFKYLWGYCIYFLISFFVMPLDPHTLALCCWLL